MGDKQPPSNVPKKYYADYGGGTYSPVVMVEVQWVKVSGLVLSLWECDGEWEAKSRR